MSATDGRSRLIPIDEIKGALNGRILDLCKELLPGGHREGSEWRCGGIAGEDGQSLGVHLSGAKAGVWQDFATGETGDAIDLVSATLCRGDKREAIAWAKQWLGWDRGETHAVELERRKAAAAIAAAQAQAPLDAAETRRKAHARWLQGSPDLLGTPVDRYLQGRGIDLRQLPRPPGAIRYHDRLWNTESGQAWPGMVAAITGADGTFLSVHRTWLQVRADGSVTKAPLREAKKTWGLFGGGLIRLTRGASNRRWSEMPDPEHLGTCEGIENALSVAIACPELRMAASVSSRNLGHLVLPSAVRTVTHFADNDESQGEKQLLRMALTRLHNEGRRVFVTFAPAGIKDANDVLRGVAS